MQGIAPAFFRDWTATLQMQVRVDIYFRTATPDTQVKFERGHREAEKQKNKEKEDSGKQYGREIKKGERRFRRKPFTLANMWKLPVESPLKKWDRRNIM